MHCRDAVLRCQSSQGGMGSSPFIRTSPEAGQQIRSQYARSVFFIIVFRKIFSVNEIHKPHYRAICWVYNAVYF